MLARPNYLRYKVVRSYHHPQLGSAAVLMVVQQQATGTPLNNIDDYTMDKPLLPDKPFPSGYEPPEGVFDLSKEEQASINNTAKKEMLLDFLWREGDRTRQFYNGLLVVIVAVAFTFHILSLNKMWLEFNNTIEDVDGGNEAIAQTRTITEGYQQTLDLVVIESGINGVVKFFLRFMAKIMPWCKTAAAFPTFFLIFGGSTKVRRSFSRVVVIREGFLDDSSSSSRSDEGDSSLAGISIIRRMSNALYLFWFPTLEWMVLGTRFKITNVYIYLLAFLALSMPAELELDSSIDSSSSSSSSSSTIVNQVDFKSGVAYFWLANFMFVTMVSFVKVQGFRWMRRERAMELYLSITATAEEEDDGYPTVAETDLEDNVNVSGGSAIAAAADVASRTSATATLATTNVSGGSEEATNNCSDDEGEEEDDDDEPKKTFKQNIATGMLCLALTSYFTLLFLPIVRFNYSTSDELADIESKEFTMYSFMTEIVDVPHNKSLVRFLQFIFWLEVSILPMIVMMVCASMKIIRYYDRYSRYLTSHFYFLAILESYSNPESITVGVFFVKWCVKYVSRHMLDEHQSCQALGLEEGCVEVTGEFLSGSWMLLIYGFTYVYCMGGCQYDLPLKLNDLMTIEAYEKILPDILLAPCVVGQHRKGGKTPTSFSDNNPTAEDGAELLLREIQ